jgi:hypothetical protein
VSYLSRSFMLIGVLAFQSIVALAAPITVWVRDGDGGVTANNTAGGFYVQNTPDTNNVRVRSNPNNAWTTSNNTNTGAFDLRISFASSTGPYLPLLTYCIDPFLPLNLPVAPTSQPGRAYTMKTAAEFGWSTTVRDRIEILWANAFTMSTQSATNAAAFQALIWEYAVDLRNGTGINLSTGRIGILDTATLNLATTWNNNITNGVWTLRQQLNILDGNPGSQSLLYVVPEPSTYAMFGIGLVGVALVGRWRSKRNV